MADRRQKIEELLERMESIKHHMFASPHIHKQMLAVTPAQMSVIMLIMQSNGIAVKDLAKTLRISSSATTQLVDGLVKNGYVERKESAVDRRVTILTLPKKVHATVKKMKEQMIQNFIEGFSVLTTEEFNQFLELNRKISQSLLNKKNN